jgi:hypothetical protein
MNDFFVRSRRDRAAKQDCALVYRASEAAKSGLSYSLTPAGDALLDSQISYALTPLAEAALVEWEAARASRPHGAR